MKEWHRISLLLCLVGFFSSLVPSDHFMYQYLTQFRDIPDDTVTNFFFPQFGYWRAGLLLIFLFVTDMLRYKPVIILYTMAGISLYATLRWTHGVNALIASTFSMGLQNSTNLAYQTYLYAKVKREKYQQVTSNIKSADLLGRCTGAIIGQFFMIYGVMNAQELIYISLSSKCLGFCLALLLPSVTTSIYFYQAKKRSSKDISDLNEGEKKVDESTLEISPYSSKSPDEELVKFSWKDATSLIKSHLKSGYSNKTVLLWSIWWILLNVGASLCYTYNQPLWHAVEPDREDVYNGFAEGGLTLFGALGALLAAKLNQKVLEKYAIWIVIVCSAAMGSFSIIASTANNVFLAYAMYIVIGAVHHFMVAITSAIVAKYLVMDSFALIFGLNGWVGSIGVFIFNIVVVSETFFSFGPRDLYMIFGCYFYALVLIFATYGIVHYFRGRNVKAVAE